MSAPSGYSKPQIRLHWIVAALIAAQYLLADPISDAARALSRGLSYEFSPLILAHVAGGVAVLALALWRLALRRSRGAPLPPDNEPAPLKLLAHLAHWALYALMVLMPVSGALAWFGGIGAAAQAHDVLKVALLALIALHVLGALFHQFVLKTDVLNRMRRAQA